MEYERGQEVLIYHSRNGQLGYYIFEEDTTMEDGDIITIDEEYFRVYETDGESVGIDYAHTKLSLERNYELTREKQYK